MSLQRAGQQPLYLQVAQHLEQDIAAGRFPPYARLMSESGLMRRFEVSRVTVRAAILRLVQKGLVDVRQGKGTFVAGPVIAQGLDRYTDINEVLRAQGFTPDRRLLEFRPATAEEIDGSPFAGATEMPIVLRRLYVLHGKPFAVIHGLVAKHVAGVSRREAAERTIVDLAKSHPGGVARADVAIRTRQVAGEIGPLLGLPRRRSVLQMQRTSYGEDGAVLDHSTLYIVPEAWEFRVSVAGPRKAVEAEPRAAPRTGVPAGVAVSD